MILDYKGTIADGQGNILPGVTQGVKLCLDAGIVFFIVSFIGIKDVYDFEHGRDWQRTRAANFFDTTKKWVRESGFATSSDKAAPGKGWIQDVRVVNDWTGRPHDSKALRATHYVDLHTTTGGKDYFSYYWHPCAAVVDDHAGVAVACLEIGMRSYLIKPRLRPTEKKPDGLYQLRDTADALDQLRKDASDPERRWELEQRQRHILDPCSDVFSLYIVTASASVL